MSLDELRCEIDEADKAILEAIEKRMDVARRIGEYKRNIGKPVYDMEREQAKLDTLEEAAGAESRPYIRELYTKIFELTRSHEDKPIFGVLGRSLPHSYSPMIHHLLTDEYTYGIIERTKTTDEIVHPAVRNAMKYLDMHELRVVYEADLPARSGLGSSSSFAVGLLNAFYCLKGKYVDKRKLADDAIYVERVLCQEGGGIQDQIAACDKLKAKIEAQNITLVRMEKKAKGNKMMKW